MGRTPARQADFMTALETSFATTQDAEPHLKVVADFYWRERSDLWELTREYVPILKEAGNRREIRVVA